MTPLYRNVDNSWVPEPEAQGYPGAQHGGAFGGLVARELESLMPAGTLPVSFAMQMLRPAAMKPIRVEVETLHGGRRMTCLRATVTIENKPVATATLMCTRPDDLAGVPPAPPVPFPGNPLEAEEAVHVSNFTGTFFHNQVDFRPLDAARYWMRLKRPLFDPMTPLANTVALADWGPGLIRFFTDQRPSLSMADPTLDLNIHLHRLPAGPWLGLEVTSHWHPNSQGQTHSQLFDTQGHLGYCTQAQLLTPMSGL